MSFIHGSCKKSTRWLKDCTRICDLFPPRVALRGIEIEALLTRRYCYLSSVGLVCRPIPHFQARSYKGSRRTTGLGARQSPACGRGHPDRIHCRSCGVIAGRASEHLPDEERRHTWGCPKRRIAPKPSALNAALQPNRNRAAETRIRGSVRKLIELAYMQILRAKLPDAGPRDVGVRGWSCTYAGSSVGIEVFVCFRNLLEMSLRLLPQLLVAFGAGIRMPFFY